MTTRWLLIRDDGREFWFDDWRCAAAAHSVLTGSRLIEKEMPVDRNEALMDRDEALKLARRLLERAGPKTEILIKAPALEALVKAAERREG
jgi:hypothetical protein